MASESEEPRCPRALSDPIAGGSALLAISALLPFVRDCDGHTVVPVEEVGLLPPHLFGLVTFVPFGVLFSGRAAAALRRFHGWSALVTVAYLAVRANMLFLRHFEAINLVFSAVSLLCVAALLLSFRRGLSWMRALGRQTWSTGSSPEKSHEDRRRLGV